LHDNLKIVKAVLELDIGYVIYENSANTVTHNHSQHERNDFPCQFQCYSKVAPTATSSLMKKATEIGFRKNICIEWAMQQLLDSSGGSLASL